LSYGGTQCIEYSDVAKSLLSEIGIRTETFYRAYDQKFYSKMGAAAFFDKDNIWRRPPGHRNGHHAVDAIPLQVGPAFRSGPFFAADRPGRPHSSLPVPFSRSTGAPARAATAGPK
jgi:hypothetical protein